MFNEDRREKFVVFANDAVNTACSMLGIGSLNLARILINYKNFIAGFVDAVTIAAIAIESCHLFDYASLRDVRPAQLTVPTPEQEEKFAELFFAAIDNVFEQDLLDEDTQEAFFGREEIFVDSLADALIRCCFDNSEVASNLVVYGLSVPNGYDSESQLDEARRILSRGQSNILVGWGGEEDPVVNGSYYQPSSRLVPGKRYLARFWRLNSQLSYYDCLEFMIGQNALLANVQAISLLVTMYEPRFFPNHLLFVSLDRESVMYAGHKNDQMMVPFFMRCQSGWFSGVIDLADEELTEHYCLVCFHDLDSLRA